VFSSLIDLIDCAASRIGLVGLGELSSGARLRLSLVDCASQFIKRNQETAWNISAFAYRESDNKASERGWVD
jgi:hypothetical protein